MEAPKQRDRGASPLRSLFSRKLLLIQVEFFIFPPVIGSRLSSEGETRNKALVGNWIRCEMPGSRKSSMNFWVHPVRIKEAPATC